MYVPQYKLFFLDCNSWSRVIQKHVNEFPAVRRSFPMARARVGERMERRGVEPGSPAEKPAPGMEDVCLLEGSEQEQNSEKLAAFS